MQRAGRGLLSLGPTAHLVGAADYRAGPRAPSPCEAQPRWRRGHGWGPHCQAEPHPEGHHPTPQAANRGHAWPERAGSQSGPWVLDLSGLWLPRRPRCRGKGEDGLGRRLAEGECMPAGDARRDVWRLPRSSASLTAMIRIPGSRAGEQSCPLHPSWPPPGLPWQWL